MYAERGDSSAFVAVKKHFEHVFAIVGAHHGAVVKTVGDAVMAAFNDPVDALRAARTIHRQPLGSSEHPIGFRISLNTGPCIAVRLNAAIDYFGHTVNLAAKLQSIADASEVGLGAATLEAPGVAAWFALEGVVLEDVPVQLKGIAEPVIARRWTVT